MRNPPKADAKFIPAATPLSPNTARPALVENSTSCENPSAGVALPTGAISPSSSDSNFFWAASFQCSSTERSRLLVRFSQITAAMFSREREFPDCCRHACKILPFNLSNPVRRICSNVARRNRFLRRWICHARNTRWRCCMCAFRALAAPT